jgi:hypothetical protein
MCATGGWTRAGPGYEAEALIVARSAEEVEDVHDGPWGGRKVGAAGCCLCANPAPPLSRRCGVGGGGTAGLQRSPHPHALSRSRMHHVCRSTTSRTCSARRRQSSCATRVCALPGARAGGRGQLTNKNAAHHRPVGKLSVSGLLRVRGWGRQAWAAPLRTPCAAQGEHHATGPWHHACLSPSSPSTRPCALFTTAPPTTAFKCTLQHAPSTAHTRTHTHTHTYI